MDTAKKPGEAERGRSGNPYASADALNVGCGIASYYYSGVDVTLTGKGEIRMGKKKQCWRSGMAARLSEEKEGAGVVELVLILVVLISLVIIFKSQLTALLNLIFEQIQSSAGSVF